MRLPSTHFHQFAAAAENICDDQVSLSIVMAIVYIHSIARGVEEDDICCKKALFAAQVVCILVSVTFIELALTAGIVPCHTKAFGKRGDCLLYLHDISRIYTH